MTLKKNIIIVALLVFPTITSAQDTKRSESETTCRSGVFPDGGKTSIHFGKNAELRLIDEKGNFVAGFTVCEKNRHFFYYPYKQNKDKKYLALGQYYSEVEFRSGFLNIKDASQDIIVSHAGTDEEIDKVRFISLSKKEVSKTKTRMTLKIALANKNGEVKEKGFWNKITGLFASNCDEFSFEVKATVPQHYNLSDDGGDFAECLGLL